MESARARYGSICAVVLSYSKNFISLSKPFELFVFKRTACNRVRSCITRTYRYPRAGRQLHRVRCSIKGCHLRKYSVEYRLGIYMGLTAGEPRSWDTAPSLPIFPSSHLLHLLTGLHPLSQAPNANAYVRTHCTATRVPGTSEFRLVLLPVSCVHLWRIGSLAHCEFATFYFSVFGSSHHHQRTAPRLPYQLEAANLDQNLLPSFGPAFERRLSVSLAYRYPLRNYFRIEEIHGGTGASGDDMRGV